MRRKDLRHFDSDICWASVPWHRGCNFACLEVPRCNFPLLGPESPSGPVEIHPLAFEADLGKWAAVGNTYIGDTFVAASIAFVFEAAIEAAADSCCNNMDIGPGLILISIYRRLTDSPFQIMDYYIFSSICETTERLLRDY